MHYLFFLIALIVVVPSVSAQRHPPMAEQQRDAEKERYFAQFNNLQRSLLPDDHRRAYEAAIEYLKRFEGDNDPDARTVRKFVTEYERGARQQVLFSTYNSKNYTKAFELGRPMLERDPENFFVLAVLAEAGFDNLLTGNSTLNDATVEYAKKALQLLESGKVSDVAPFKDRHLGTGYLNVAIGTILKDKSPTEAAQAFRKAIQTESHYREDPLLYYRLGVAILKGEFEPLSKEYNEKYGAQQSSPAQQALLARIIKVGEQAIDAYARAVALSDPARAGSATAIPSGVRTQIIGQLTTLYKSFHNGSDAGLNELIAGVLSKPMP